MNRAPLLSEPSRTRLTQTVSRALRKPCLVTLFAEPVAETVRSEGPAKLSNEESHLADRAFVDDRLQFGQHRQPKFCASLSLFDMELAVANVLPTHPHNIRATLAGVE